jgi:hypothetical protein
MQREMPQGDFQHLKSSPKTRQKDGEEDKIMSKRDVRKEIRISYFINRFHYFYHSSDFFSHLIVILFKKRNVIFGKRKSITIFEDIIGRQVLRKRPVRIDERLRRSRRI